MNKSSTAKRDANMSEPVLSHMYNAAAMQEPCATCRSTRCSCGSTEPKPQSSAQAMSQGGDLFQQVGDIAATAEQIGGILEMGAGFLDRPDDRTPNTRVRPTTAGSWVHGVGVSNSTSLTVGPGAVQPKGSVPMKPTTLKAQLTREGVCHIGTFSTATVNDAEILQLPVSPNVDWNYQVGPPKISTCKPTPLSWHSQPYTFWRGAINYRVEVICSQYLGGRLSILFEPFRQVRDALPNGLEENRGYYELVEFEIKGPTTCPFEVPNNSAHVFNVNPDPAAFWPGLNYNTANRTLSARYQCEAGQLHFRWLNAPVRGTTDAEDVTIVVYHSAGENFEVWGPHGNRLESFYPAPYEWGAGVTDIPTRNIGTSICNFGSDRESASVQETLDLQEAAATVGVPEILAEELMKTRRGLSALSSLVGQLRVKDQAKLEHMSGRPADHVVRQEEPEAETKMVYSAVRSADYHSAALGSEKDLDGVFAKEFLLDRFDWNNAFFGRYVKLPNWKTLAGASRTAFPYHLGLRAATRFGLRIRPVINGTGSHKGRLAISFVPHEQVLNDSQTVTPLWDSKTSTSNPTDFLQYPHVTLDPSTPNPKSLTIPLTVPQGVMTPFMSGESFFGAIFVGLVAPLTGPTGASDLITVSLMAEFVDVEGLGDTNPAYSYISNTLSDLPPLQHMSAPEAGALTVGAEDEDKEINQEPEPVVQELEAIGGDDGSVEAAVAHFGESHMDYYATMARAQFIGRRYFDHSGGSGHSTYHMYLVVHPRATVGYQNNYARSSTDRAEIGATVPRTLLSHHSYGNIGWAGSLCYKMMIRGSNLGAATLKASVLPVTGERYSNGQSGPSTATLHLGKGNALLERYGFTSTSTSDTTYERGMSTTYGQAVEAASIQPVLDVRVPYQSPFAYLPLTYDSFFWTDSSENVNYIQPAPGVASVIHFEVCVNSKQDENYALEFFISAGDDFKFIGPTTLPQTAVSFYEGDQA